MGRVERIAEGVYRIDAVPFRHAINVLLVRDGDAWTLVDTGVGSSADRIGRAIESLGAHPRP